MHAPDDAGLNAVALSPDGTTLAVSDFIGKLLFFDARTYAPIGKPLPVDVWIESVAYSPDGKTLAYGASASFASSMRAHARSWQKPSSSALARASLSRTTGRSSSL